MNILFQTMHYKKGKYGTHKLSNIEQDHNEMHYVTKKRENKLLKFPKHIFSGRTTRPNYEKPTLCHQMKTRYRTRSINHPLNELHFFNCVNQV